MSTIVSKEEAPKLIDQLPLCLPRGGRGWGHYFVTSSLYS
jgi:hypothetical protein